MKIGIDASNIRSGGGLTHLQELLNTKYVQQKLRGVEIEVWGNNSLSFIIESDVLKVRIFTALDQGVVSTFWWQLRNLPKLARSVDIVFAPGGLFAVTGVPYVSMSQNMLVFQKEERNRFTPSLNWLRYNLLEQMQLRSFRRAKGILYISNFARDYIENKYPELRSKLGTVIYHGISDRFLAPKPRMDQPLCPNFLYVSIVNFYKHQWNVVEAIERLNQEGLHCKLTLVGPANPSALPRLERALEKSVHTSYLGKVPFEEIDKVYADADAFLFASSCENMPNIMVEAMSAGLPIFSSNLGPMPEVLADNGEYFDPLDPASIADCLRPYLAGEKIFSSISVKSWRAAKEYSWNHCAEQTIAFITDCYRSIKA
jgi:glycosyltransferase involved in cell wall biosynthesis